MYFFLKKLIGTLLMPLPLALLVSLAGAVLLIRRRRVAGGMLVGLALLGIFAAAWGPVADGLLGPLESRYPPLLNAARYPQAVAVVVLGTGYNQTPGLPFTSQFDETALARLDEGIRLHRQLPGARLVLSGGSFHSRRGGATGYVKAALALGVPASDIVPLRGPRDTAQEARAARKLIGTHKPFILVTSAFHMPRAVRLFHREGLKPIPAPAGYESLRENRSRPDYWVPSARQLRKTEQAFHEYLGMLAVGLDHWEESGGTRDEGRGTRKAVKALPAIAKRRRRVKALPRHSQKATEGERIIGNKSKT